VPASLSVAALSTTSEHSGFYSVTNRHGFKPPVGKKVPRGKPSRKRRNKVPTSPRATWSFKNKSPSRRNRGVFAPVVGSQSVVFVRPTSQELGGGVRCPGPGNSRAPCRGDRELIDFILPRQQPSNQPEFRINSATDISRLFKSVPQGPRHLIFFAHFSQNDWPGSGRNASEVPSVKLQKKPLPATSPSLPVRALNIIRGDDRWRLLHFLLLPKPADFFAPSNDC